MRLFTTLAILMSALVLTACGGDSDNDIPPPQANPAVNYTAFVKVQLANTDDQREATSINNIRFIYRDMDNPQAYDNVLDPAN